MAFILSKALLFLIAPLNWVVVLLLYGLLARNGRRRRLACASGALATVFFTNPFLGNAVLNLWEPAPMAISEIDAPFDVGIVLGGFARAQAAPRDRLHLSDDSDRLIHALELYRRGKIRKILISSGAGNVLGEKIDEASVTSAFLLRMGVPAGDVIIENRARNTHENALYTARLLEARMPEARCLLLTSAFHMRRALACFRKQDLEVTPFATDMSAQPLGFSPYDLILPNPMGFQSWGRLIKEWVGFAVYRMRGFA